MEAGRARLWLSIGALVLLVASVGLLFLPYKASSDPGLFQEPGAPFPGITIECGNFFQGIGGGPSPESPEIVEGLEEFGQLPNAQALNEIIEAEDGCTAGGLVRVGISGALLLVVLVLSMRSRRRTGPAEDPLVGEPGESPDGE